MKTKQKHSSPLSLKFLLNKRLKPYLVVRSGIKSFRIKNIKSINELIDMLFGSMILTRELIEATVSCPHFTRGPKKLLLETSRTKKGIGFKITDEYCKNIDGVVEEEPTLDVKFEWSGTPEIFQLAISEMLLSWPDYKIFNLITSKSIV